MKVGDLIQIKKGFQLRLPQMGVLVDADDVGIVLAVTSHKPHQVVECFIKEQRCLVFKSYELEVINEN